ncbi:hypothetical protein ACFOSV_12015 [Algoriphagus namhaensis]|uniref:DUF1574 domain-containing protein n=1 Tax=Algoriphagus namhaensis TaxID=915353 RepID=A0ABV8AVF3_9BACT
MKKFLLKFVLTFSFLVIALFLMDFLIVEGLKTSNYREITKWNDVVSGKVETDVLIVGSSRALVHFDCELFEKIVGTSCYNLGFNGTNLTQQIKMLQLFLRKNNSPKKIIWSLDYHMFENREQFFGFDQLIPFMAEKEIKELVQMNNIDEPWLYNFPVARFSFNRKMKLVGLNNLLGFYKNGRPLIKGFIGEDKGWDGEFELIRAKAKEQLYYKVDQESKKSFLEIIDFIQSQDIEIEFVISPIYYELNEFAENEDEIKKEFRTLAETYDIKLYDFSEDEIGRDRQYFYNSLHLNLKGVSKFNQLYYYSLIQKSNLD